MKYLNCCLHNAQRDNILVEFSLELKLVMNLTSKKVGTVGAKQCKMPNQIAFVHTYAVTFGIFHSCVLNNYQGLSKNVIILKTKELRQNSLLSPLASCPQGIC